MIINPILKKTIANSVDSEKVVVDLDMKDGDQVIMPSAGKVLGKATVKKPSTFLPENIKKGVTIAGVVGSYKEETTPSGDPITSEAEFLAMKEDGDYYLANDITVSESYGTFRGRLHGNGKTVTVSAPLFESLEGASVCDLTIKGIVYLPEAAYVGALTCTATTVNICRVINEADVSGRACAAGLVGYTSDTCVFWGCVNAGTVHSYGGYAAGILAYGKKDATFTHCINVGEITTSVTDSSKAGYYCASGIVSWVGGTGLLYYCVNTGYILGNTHVSGIGGRFGETEDINGHIVFGCLNIGQLHSSSGDAAGLIRRAYGRSEINYNTVSGSLKTDDGKVSALLGYSTSTASNYNKNVINIKPEDVSGDEVYLVTAGAASAQSASASNLSDIFVLTSTSGATFENLFKRADNTVVQMPSNYKYYFTKEQREDGTLVSKLGTEFVMEDGIPMHRGVIGTYRIAREMMPQGETPSILTVNFAYEEEWEDDETQESGMIYPRSTATGSYTIDNGGAVYFEDMSSLSIDVLVGSVVKIYLSLIRGGCSDEYSIRDAVGCEGGNLCKEEGHELFMDEYETCGEFGGCCEGVKITITEPTASFTAYSHYA